MKIAVCISGLQRNVSIPTKIIVDRYHSAFPDADFYYHTWEGKEIYTNLPLTTSVEPELNYHPVEDIPRALEWFSENRKNYWDLCKKHKNHSETSKHGNKQILAHSFLVSKLKHMYDIIVRARWDVLLSDKTNYLNICKDVNINKVPIGFANNNHILDGNQEKHKYHNYTISPIQYKNDLADLMIIHKHEHFDTFHVNQLYSSKDLCPIEFGWWQVLCQHNNIGYKRANRGVILCR